jgi:hypothetical protein
MKRIHKISITVAAFLALALSLGASGIPGLQKPKTGFGCHPVMICDEHWLPSANHGLRLRRI